MEGYRKILAALIPIIVGAINASLVGINVPLPEDYTWTTLGVWFVQAVVLMLPTIVTLLSTTYYTKKNVEEAKAFAVAQSMTGNVVSKPGAITVSPPAAAGPGTPSAPVALWTYADVNAIATAELAKYKGDILSAAYGFYRAAMAFDLSKVQPKVRVQQAQEFIAKAQELFITGFKYYTQLDCPPLADFSNKAKVMFKIKQDYEKANNLVCSDKTFDEIRNLVGYIDDFIEINQGMDLVGTDSENLDWGTFSGRIYNPFDVAYYAGSLAKTVATKKAK